MTYDLLQFAIFFFAFFVLCPPLGSYMAAVYEGKRTWLTPVLAPVEKVLYKIVGTKQEEEQNWGRYALSAIGFNLVGFLILYAIMRLQDHLPLNPAGEAAVAPHLAFNTAVSFITNTNWQSYGGESTMSYFTQMVGLTVQNFLSAATGMAVAMAVVRGFVRKQTDKIGNFWVDMVRSTFYILLPISIIGALFLVWQGMPQNMHPYVTATTMEGAQQTIAQGPVASQIVIKQLGTNGGGYFNANSAHPYENPTPLTNWLEDFFLLWISGALCFTFGKLTGDPRQGRAIFGAMTFMLLVALAVCYIAEKQGNPFIASDVVQTDGNMEGKEVRLGVANSTLWAATTTATSCGAVNSMHDSFTPIGGLVPMFLLMTGEVVFGGVGSGLAGAVSLLLGMDRNLTPSNIKSILSCSADLIGVDTTGSVMRRLNMSRAAQMVASGQTSCRTVIDSTSYGSSTGISSGGDYSHYATVWVSPHQTTAYGIAKGTTVTYTLAGLTLNGCSFGSVSILFSTSPDPTVSPFDSYAIGSASGTFTADTDIPAGSYLFGAAGACDASRPVGFVGGGDLSSSIYFGGTWPNGAPRNVYVPSFNWNLLLTVAVH